MTDSQTVSTASTATIACACVFGPIKYEKEKTLGQGTHASVFRVVINKNLYALKNCISYFSSYIVREAAIMLFLNHPGIVRIEKMDIRYISDNDINLKMVMPLAKYDLFDLISKNHKKVLRGYTRYAFQIVDAVMYCHEKGIVHRDIKPQNILYFKSSNALKLADFGLSRSHSCSSNYGNWTKLVYTIWYRAPEVLFGDCISEKSDVWALGCVLYQMLTKYPLVMGTTEEDVIFKLYGLFGKPTEETWPGVKKFSDYEEGSFPYDKPSFAVKVPFTIDESLEDLLRSMLVMNPEKRIGMCEVYNHRFFKNHRAQEKVPKGSIDKLNSLRSDIIDVFKFSTEYRKERQTLIDWMVKVCEEYKLELSTLFMAVNIVDRIFTTLPDVPQKKFQLYGASSIFVASIYNDYITISPWGCTCGCDDNTLTKSDINRCAVEILMALKFDVIRATSADYLKVYVEPLKWNSTNVCSLKDKSVVDRIIYKKTLNYSLGTEACLNFSQKRIAKACKYICDRFTDVPKDDAITPVTVSEKTKEVANYILNQKNGLIICLTNKMIEEMKRKIKDE